MLIVFLTNRKDYEPFLADVVFAFEGLENFGIISHRFRRCARLWRTSSLINPSTPSATTWQARIFCFDRNWGFGYKKDSV